MVSSARPSFGAPRTWPLTQTLKAWFCSILSAFAVVILSSIGTLFYRGHESMVGSIHDPENGRDVARTIFGAVGVYALFLLFCGTQLLLHRRQRRLVLS